MRGNAQSPSIQQLPCPCLMLSRPAARMRTGSFSLGARGNSPCCGAGPRHGGDLKSWYARCCRARAVRLFALGLAASAVSTTAHAAAGGASLGALAEGRLVPGAPRIGGMPGVPFWPGVTLGLDGGAAFPVALSGQRGQTSVGAGARLGYQLANGLEPFVRFDVLGVSTTLIDCADLRTATAGARYSIAFLLPTPFFE